MYFSKLVSTLVDFVVIKVVIVDGGGEDAYIGKLSDLPFHFFRMWHDYKVLEITPMYAKDEKKPFMRIEIEYADRVCGKREK